MNSRIRVNYDKNVSKRAVDYIKLKTNNSFRVSSLSKNHISFSSGSIHNRETSFGTVETDKEVVVINEENSKHTFNIKTTDTSDDSIINLIIVQATDTIYEYFLKYNFTGYKYFKEDSSIDMSRYTGTVETFNSEGALVGITTVEDGSITNVEGSNSPCPEDEEVLIDNDTSDSTDNNTGGGAPNEDDTSNDDDYYSGNGTESDTGGGSWIDGGPDWQPCTLANVYYQPCPVQESTGDTTPQPHTAEQCGAGVGSGYVYVWDCSSTFRTDGSSDPCDGAVGVLIDLRQECAKITDFFENNPPMQGSLNILAGATLTEPNEMALTMQTDGAVTVLNESPEGEISVAIPYNPPSTYNMVSHIHIENDSAETMSVFSFEDIIGFGQMCNNNKLDDDVIFFLSTGKGTHFAMTLTDTSKLCNFAYGKGLSLEEQALLDINQALLSRSLRTRVYREYYDVNNPNSIIREDNTDNEEVLKAFMEFIAEADLGVQLFETDENFENFSPLELENDQVVRRICN